MTISRKDFAGVCASALLVLALCLAFLLESEIAGFIAVFYCGLAAFTIIAIHADIRLTYWKLIDYPWILTAVVTILLGLYGLELRNERADLHKRRQGLIDSFSALIYVAEATVADNCNPSPHRAQLMTPQPEPYPDACGRVGHFLPQMRRTMAELLQAEGPFLPQDVSGMSSWAGNLIYENSDSWMGLSSVARKLRDDIELYLRQTDSNRAAYIKAYNFDRPVGPRGWLILLSLLTALRISRVTAELLQSSRTT